jgi:hypothetical protein
VSNENLTTKELIHGHGPAGAILLRLRRHGFIGWALFIVTALFFMAYVFLMSLKPTPVLAVDEQGRVLGHFEYLSAESRTNEELVGGSIQFLRYYLSANSAFIIEDFAAALNMMAEPLREKKLQTALKTQQILRIQEAKSRSHIVLSVDQPPMIDRRELRAQVRLVGELEVQVGTEIVTQPFDITLDIETIPRTTLSTAGINVIDIIDN